MSRNVPQRPGRGQQMPDMGQLMQQAMQMQAEMQRQREELLDRTFEGSAGGGVVTAVVRGDGSLVRVTIDPDVLDDAGMLGDLVVAAVNAALGVLNEAATEGLGSLGGLDLGDLGGLLG